MKDHKSRFVRIGEAIGLYPKKTRSKRVQGGQSVALVLIAVVLLALIWPQTRIIGHLQPSLDEIRDEMDTNENEIQSLRRTASDIAVRLNAIEPALGKLQPTVQANAAQIESLQRDTSALKQEISTFNGRLDNLIASISELPDILENLGEVRSLVQTVNSQGEAIKALAATTEALRQTLVTIQGRLSTAETKLTELSEAIAEPHDLSELVGKVSSLESLMISVQGELSELRSALDTSIADQKEINRFVLDVVIIDNSEPYVPICPTGYEPVETDILESLGLDASTYDLGGDRIICRLASLISFLEAVVPGESGGPYVQPD